MYYQLQMLSFIKVLRQHKPITESANIKRNRSQKGRKKNPEDLFSQSEGNLSLPKRCLSETTTPDLLSFSLSNERKEMEAAVFFERGTKLRRS